MADLTYTLQELEALLAKATPGPWARGEEHETKAEFYSPGSKRVLGSTVGSTFRSVVPHSENAELIVAAVNALPELIARIKELDPAYNAKPPPDSVARATDLMREAAEKRAKLDKALADASMPDQKALAELGVEAFTDDDGEVKIRQKKRAAP